MPRRAPDEVSILRREESLRSWLTRGRSQSRQEIDGLDVGWGGVQRWASAQMSLAERDRHLDFACGVGTFLAELGWRFPKAHLVGLNIDFAGPHEPIRALLAEAGVECTLVQADARRMPFGDGSFRSVSCFLGLQDIEIGFGEHGVRAALSEAARVLRPSGTLTIIDEFRLDKLGRLFAGIPFRVVRRAARPLEVKWSRAIAEEAIVLFADGWVNQIRDADADERARARAEVLRRMGAEIDRQISARGYYIPFGPARLMQARKR